MTKTHILTIEVFKRENNKLSFRIYRKSEDIVTWSDDCIWALENGITIHDENDPCITGIPTEFTKN